MTAKRFGIHEFRPLLFVLLALVAPSAVFAQDVAPKEIGLFLTVPNPITERDINILRNQITQARARTGVVLKKVLFDFNPNDKDAATPNYGACYDLAKEIRTLSNNGITTVAFVHAKTTRHTVLPVIACNDLVMSSGAQLGEVLEAGAVPQKNELDFYNELAGPRSAIVLKMIDKNVEVFSGLQNQSIVYFDSRRRNEPQFQNLHNPQPVTELAPGNVELYSAEKAVKYGLCKIIKETRKEVADLYEVPPYTDFRGSRPPKAARIDVIGQIDDALREKLRRQLDSARANKETDIFLVLETAGGEPAAARAIADDILSLGQLEEPIRVIAFIPRNAPDLSVFIAFASNEIVMYSANGEEAVLGDFANYLDPLRKKDKKNINLDFLKRNLMDVAKERQHSPALVDAMFDKDMVLVRAKSKTGERKLMTRQEMEAQGWELDKTIKERGQLLKLNAALAVDVRLAAQTIASRDINDLIKAYNFEIKDVRDAKPHWLDSFAAFLRRDEVAILLILIGIGGLILEMKVPGMTIPGITAAICFVLFFWAQSSVSGQIIYLAILLFLLGLVMIGLEIFVIPGFGVTGIAGILLVIGGLGLATLDKMPQTSEEWLTFGGRVMQYGLTMVAAATITMLFARYLPKIPYANRLMLVPPTDKPDAGEPVFLPGAEQAASLLGASGVATSMLRPAGSAQFGEVFVDVVTEGDFVNPGTPIQVIEVEGTRIVVKRI